MDLHNSFDALDPRNPGFIGLESESEIDSVSDDRRDDVYSECHATSCSIAVEFEGKLMRWWRHRCWVACQVVGFFSAT